MPFSPFDLLGSIGGWVILGLALVGVAAWRGKGPALVLQRFAVLAHPEAATSPVIDILGRPPEVITFLLTTVGFNATTRFTVSDSEVRCQSTSLFGQRFQFVPLRAVGTFAAGLYKPFGYLIVAALLLLSGVYYCVQQRFNRESIGGLALATLVAGVLAVVYFFSKKFFLEVHPDGGPPIRLLFKPSAIEGVSIDVEKAVAAIGVIRDLVLRDASSLQTILDPDGEKRKQYTEQLRQEAEAQLAHEAGLKQLQEAQERERREASIQHRKEQEEAAERRRKEAAEQKRKTEIERQKEEERLANASSKVNCPSCNRKVTITDLRAGNEYQCPHCKRAFTIS